MEWSSEAAESTGLFIASWRRFNGSYSSAEIFDLPGLAIAFSKANAPFMNMCVLTGPAATLEELRQRVEAACSYAGTAGVPWLFVACDSGLPKGADAAMTEAGFVRAVQLTAMSAGILKPPRKNLALLRFKRVDEARPAEVLASINASAYGLPPEAAPAMTAPALWDGECFSYLGCLGDRAVTCSAALPVDGQLYVAWVATLPEYGGRGYAEAVMRHSISEAARAADPRRIHLHASAAGRPLYVRMGFETSVTFSLYYRHAEV